MLNRCLWFSMVAAEVYHSFCASEFHLEISQHSNHCSTWRGCNHYSGGMWNLEPQKTKEETVEDGRNFLAICLVTWLLEIIICEQLRVFKLWIWMHLAGFCTAAHRGSFTFGCLAKPAWSVCNVLQVLWAQSVSGSCFAIQTTTVLFISLRRFRPPLLRRSGPKTCVCYRFERQNQHKHRHQHYSCSLWFQLRQAENNDRGSPFASLCEYRRGTCLNCHVHKPDSAQWAEGSIRDEPSNRACACSSMVRIHCAVACCFKGLMAAPQAPRYWLRGNQPPQNEGGENNHGEDLDRPAENLKRRAMARMWGQIQLAMRTVAFNELGGTFK